MSCSPSPVEMCNGLDDNGDQCIDNYTTTTDACRLRYPNALHVDGFNCDGGECSLSCTLPFADGDGVVANGCESGSTSWEPFSGNAPTTVAVLIRPESTIATQPLLLHYQPTTGAMLVEAVPAALGRGATLDVHAFPPRVVHLSVVEPKLVLTEAQILTLNQFPKDTFVPQVPSQSAVLSGSANSDVVPLTEFDGIFTYSSGTLGFAVHSDGTSFVQGNLFAKGTPAPGQGVYAFALNQEKLAVYVNDMNELVEVSESGGQWTTASVIATNVKKEVPLSLIRVANQKVEAWYISSTPRLCAKSREAGQTQWTPLGCSDNFFDRAAVVHVPGVGRLVTATFQSGGQYYLAADLCASPGDISYGDGVDMSPSSPFTLAAVAPSRNSTVFYGTLFTQNLGSSQITARAWTQSGVSGSPHTLPFQVGPIERVVGVSYMP